MPSAAVAAEPISPPPAPRLEGRARLALIKRLADVVGLPQTRVNAFERSMTADLLVEMLREAHPSERVRVARRLALLAEIPSSLLRLLLRDGVEVARPILEQGRLADTDLLGCIAETGHAHQRLIAARKEVSEVVVQALVDRADVPTLQVLLRNPGARFCSEALEGVTALTRGQPQLIAELLRRPELRPAQAYVVFWWAGPAERRTVLTRFAVSREVLQEAAGDVFAMCAAENWDDPLARKALQFIERRQRNRAAIEKSPYANLEEAVSLAQDGLTQELAEEIAYLSGLKPLVGAKIMADPGGEAMAILCKATGLPRAALVALWRGLRRAEAGPDGAPSPALCNALETYDVMAVDRAQTVLRYWNWSLSSALTPALLRALRHGDDLPLDPNSTPQRAAALALAGDLAA
ncbi:MAG: DUF2336 domain-containing protein [Caulobacteraceae bacterium]|nr:DUF2336 domain-containing protein [Caulobacter sp.]